MKLLFKSINLLLLLFWLSYALDAWLQRKTTTDRIQSVSGGQYRGRGGPSGNYFLIIQTSRFSFTAGHDEGKKLNKGDSLTIRLTPIYKIVVRYCTMAGAENCYAAADTPYNQPFYILLISVLVLFILYTLLFEKELRFLKRLTLGNAIATLIFAFIFISLFVIS